MIKALVISALCLQAGINCNPDVLIDDIETYRERGAECVVIYRTVTERIDAYATHQCSVCHQINETQTWFKKTTYTPIRLHDHSIVWKEVLVRWISESCYYK